MTLAVAGARSQRRYDAAQTIEAFATRLREHTDLDALTSELLTVVDHTMQPTGCRCGSNRSGRPDAVIAVEGHMAEVVDYLRTVARASARSRSERWAEAAALWARVVERNPVNGNHWDRLAEARFGLGDYQGALAAYEKVLELGVWEHAAGGACHTPLLGAQLPHLDQHPLDEVVMALEPLISRDNQQWPKQVAPMLPRQLPLLHALGLAADPRRRRAAGGVLQAAVRPRCRQPGRQAGDRPALERRRQHLPGGAAATSPGRLRQGQPAMEAILACREHLPGW